MNLLLIDNDKSFLNSLENELKKKEHTIITAVNTSLALQVLKQNRIDLILSSTIISGSQVLLFVCNVKGRYPNTPLILMSSADSGFNFNTAQLLGADELIPRNLELNQLCNTISRYSA